MIKYLARVLGGDIVTEGEETKLQFTLTGVMGALTDIAIGGAAGFLPTFFVMKKKINELQGATDEV